MPKPKKTACRKESRESENPTALAGSAYGKRPSSADELLELIRLQIPEIPVSNAGAHDVWIPTFLKALGLSANWTLAAMVAGVDQTTPGKRAGADPEFALAAAAAERQAIDLLEAVSFKSAVWGDLEPVYHQGVKVGEIVRYSDRMRELLLKAHRPEKYRDRLSVDSIVRTQTPALTAEDRQKMVLELLPTLGDYARFLKARPVVDV